MESSKRIFVVLSTILFLEASAHSTQPIHNNFNQPGFLHGTHSNNGPTMGSHLTGTFGSELHHQTNYQNFPSNSHQNVHGPTLNHGLSSELGSTNMGGLNSGQGSTFKPDSSTGLRFGHTANLNTVSGSHHSSGGLKTGQYGLGLSIASLNTGQHNTADSNTEYRPSHNSGSNFRFGSNDKTGSSIGLGSNFNSGSSGSTPGRNSNNAYGSTIGGFKNIDGSYPSTLNISPGKNLIDGKSYSSLYPSSPSTASLGQQSSTNTQPGHNYNGLPNNPTTTGLYSSQSRFEDHTNAGGNKFQMVNVPLNMGSGLDQTLQIPLTGKAKYKILHLNPTNINIPDNVRTTLTHVESGVHKAIDTNKNYNLERYQLNSPQISSSGYGNQATAQPIGSTNQNQDTASLLESNNYDYNKNLQNNVQSTLVKTDLELSKILGVSDNQKGTDSTLAGNQYDSSYNFGYQYPGTHKLYNYNQPYTTSNSQAQGSATSSTSSTKQDEPNIYNLNYNKDTIPNNLIGTLNDAKLNIEKVLGKNEKVNDNQQGLPQRIPDTYNHLTSTKIGGQYVQNVLQYPATNTLYNYNQPYDNSQVTSLSYSNAQANANSLKQDGYNNYNLYSNKNILTNKDLTSLTIAELELKEVLDSVAKGKTQDNQQNIQTTTFASSNSSSTATADQYGNLPYNNERYYPGTNILQPYNQPQGYGNLAPLTSSVNSQPTASATATASSSSSSSSTTQIGQNPQGNYYYSSYLKPTDLTGINQPQTYTTGDQYNAPLSSDDTKKDSESGDYGSAKQVTTSTTKSTQGGRGNTYLNGFPNTFNLGPNRYNNFNNYNLQFGNRPNHTSFNGQKYLNQPNSTPPQSTNSPDDKNAVSNNPTSLGNTKDTTYTQTNYGLNYPISNAPSSNIDTGTQYSSTYTKDGTTGIDTTKSTATSSSTSEILSLPYSKFHYRPHGYNLNPNRKIHHRYPSFHGHPQHGYQPNIMQSPTTDSTIDENAAQTDKPTFDNVHDTNTANNDNSPLKPNDGTQQYPSNTNIGVYEFYDFGNSGTTDTESTASAQATASSSQTVTTNQQITETQGLYGQNYGYQYQPTDSSVDTVTSNPIASGNEQGSTLLSSQTSGDSNSSINKTLLYNTDDGTSSTQTQSSTDNTNDQSFYNGNYHKYFNIHKKHYGNRHYNNQPQTTDSSQYDDSTTTQSPIDYKNDQTQDSISYVNEDDIVDKTTITDDSSTVSNTQSDNINGHNKNNQHGGSYHHRYLHGNKHPRLNLNRHNYGYETKYTHPRFPNYSYDKYGTPYQSSSVNKYQSSQSDTSYESTENAPSSNDDEKPNTNNNQKISNSYDNNDYSLNNQQTSFDSYNQYGNYNAGYGGDKTQISSTDTITDANDSSYGYSPTTEQFVETDKNEATDINNAQYSEDGYQKPTGETSSSSGSSVGSSSSGNSSSGSSSEGSSSSGSSATDSSSSGSSSSSSSSSGSASSESSSAGSSTSASSSAGSSSSGSSSSGSATSDSSSAGSSTSASSSAGSSSSGSSSSGSSSASTSSADSSLADSSSSSTSASSSSSSSSSSSGTAIQKQGQSCEPKTPGLSTIGTTLNTKADGTPYSLAVDALFKILDSIEKLFLNKDTSTAG